MNNTVVTVPDGGAVFRLFDGIDSLEAHNNVLAVRGGGSMTVVREVEANWVSGATTIAGRNNWIQTGAKAIPAGFSDTLQGDDPGFTDLANDDLRPAQGSPLVDAGATSLAGPAGHDFPNGLPAPLYLPPAQILLAQGSAEGRNNVGVIDIGAWELGGGGAPQGGSSGGGGTSGSNGGTSGSSGTTGSSSSGAADGAPGDNYRDAVADDAADCTCTVNTEDSRDHSYLFLIALTALAVRARAKQPRDA